MLGVMHLLIEIRSKVSVSHLYFIYQGENCLWVCGEEGEAEGGSQLPDNFHPLQQCLPHLIFMYITLTHLKFQYMYHVTDVH